MSIVTNFPKIRFYNGGGYIEQLASNNSRLKRQDKKSRDSGTIVGRFFEEVYDDGVAIYVVVKENVQGYINDTVSIKRCIGFGDDAKNAPKVNVDRSYALRMIDRME